jgi:hypothetical protein
MRLLRQQARRSQPLQLCAQRGAALGHARVLFRHRFAKGRDLLAQRGDAFAVEALAGQETVAPCRQLAAQIIEHLGRDPARRERGLDPHGQVFPGLHVLENRRQSLGLLFRLRVRDTDRRVGLLLFGVRRIGHERADLRGGRTAQRQQGDQRQQAHRHGH